MEADIILEAFNDSIPSYKLIYNELIADGDSSVYSRIRKECLYGMSVDKIECKNHAVKNYGKALYSLQKELSGDDRKKAAKKLLTTKIIKRLQKIAQKALYVNENGSVDQLSEDLARGPEHVFGNHLHCREGFCETPGTVLDNWNMVKATGVVSHIECTLIRLQDKVHQLIANMTTNPAENFMSLLCKYNAGKRKNMIQRCSFHGRAIFAALATNLPVVWIGNVYELLTSQKPGLHFQRFLDKAVHVQQENRKIKAAERLEHPKPKKVQINNNSLPEYGPNTIKAEPTIADLETKRKNIEAMLRMTDQEIEARQKDTIGQWNNSLYMNTRNIRLTASIFGQICKQRPQTRCTAIVYNLFKDKNFSNEATRFGKNHEIIAIRKVKKENPQFKVEPCGIFISKKHQFLGASPDGLVNENGILEVKCLYSAKKNKKTIEQVAIEGSNCLEKVDGIVRLKKTHNYYYQVQGQLNVSEKEFCFFIVYISDEDPLHVECIKPNKALWDEMVLKLQSFYYTCFFPRLVNPKYVCSVCSAKTPGTTRKRNKND